ncbi:glycosyltransferase family 4 protein [Halorussus marinus]|uniref:glycosyltransferase family 4 protein n=1 Tax=Halorussus marinus TaxID=2505976 RepID=UPI001091919C|nr:glycosyltransferase family 4 protein [Halorussus marinus]
MSDRTTVLFFHTAYESFGGASQMLLRLLTSIDRDKFLPIVLSQSSDELCQRAAEQGIEVEIVPFRGILDTYNRELLSFSPAKVMKTGARIFQFNVEAKYLLKKSDVIWCKNIREVLTLVPNTFVVDASIIWNIGLGLQSKGKMAYLNELGLRVADTVFMEYEEQADQVFTNRQQNTYSNKFTFFHKGIDVDEFSPSKQPSPGEFPTVIGTAAVLSERKGIEYLIEAIEDLYKNGMSIELRIAGKPPNVSDSPYKQRLENRVKEKGIDDIVTFVGWVEDMPTFLDDLDVFVLPSFGEGIPGAVREALAMERPVVATDVGGTSEVVQDGETGLLVEPGNAQSITQALGTLIENPGYATDLGTSGREHIVQEYSMGRYVERYEKLLESLAT